MNVNSTGLRDVLGVAVILALVVFSLAGRLFPGASSWGFHYHAYLPLPLTVTWAVLTVAFFLPSSQRRMGPFFEDAGPRFVFSASGPIVLAAVFGLLFALLSERSYFMGDGYLVGELVEKGMPFRSFDNMDYFLHFQVYKAFRNPMDPGAISSFAVYRWGSVIAGVIGVLTITLLAARLAWSPWQKLLVVGLFLFSGPAAMFYGYVESYGYLLVFVSAFLLSAVLVLQGRLGLWVASTFFGLALFMHLTGVFGAPVLLLLALFAPVRSAARRWLEALGPAVLIFSVSVLAHLVTGYDSDFFRKEFLEAKNTKNLWVPMTGPHGFLSVEHWRDLLNLAFLSLPVPLAILLLRFRTVASGARERTAQLLLVHAAFVLIFVLFIDRKLGGARDWDLFAAHGFGLVLLAVWTLGERETATWVPQRSTPQQSEPAATRSVAGAAKGGGGRAPDQGSGRASDQASGRTGGRAPEKPSRRATVPATGRASVPVPGRARVTAPGRAQGGQPAHRSGGRAPALARVALPAAALLSVPWVLLLHNEDASIARFTDVAAGFARFPRAYAYEELGKYYREADDVDRAVRMYELCVETYPSNGRFHVLLGSMYIRKFAIVLDEEEKRSYLARAEASYREGARLQEADPHAVTLSNLGKSLSMQGKWEDAVSAHGRASELDPSDAENWINLGNALLQVGRLDDAVGSYRNALGLDGRLRIRRQLGAALLGSSQFVEAESAFREGIRLGEDRRVLGYGLAASLVAQADRARDRGEVPPLEKMAEAEQLLRAILEENPADEDAQAVYGRLRSLMGEG